MNVSGNCPVVTLALAVLCLCTGMAGTIDPNKPLPNSLKPDLLYIDFEEERGGHIISQAEAGFSASVETGKVGAPPTRKPGPGAAFGHALEFNYGSHRTFTESNDQMAGNHLRVDDDASLRLAGQSFTLGAWIQIPEGVELPDRPYKKIISKGGHADSYPGWGLQLSGRDGLWYLTLLLVDFDSALTRRDAQLPTGSLEPGAWHHVAASFDADTKILTLWFDGLPVFTGDAPTEVGESKLPLVIGENGMSTYCNIPLVMDEVFITSGVHDFVPVER